MCRSPDFFRFPGETLFCFGASAFASALANASTAVLLVDVRRLYCAGPSLCPTHTDDRQLIDDIWRNPTGHCPVFIDLVPKGNGRVVNRFS